MSNLTYGLLQAFLALLLAPGLNGVIKKFKALLQNRQGPPILQPYRDLRKFIAKEPVASSHSSLIFRAAPYLAFAAYLAAALYVPIFPWQPPLGSTGGLVALVYLLALARVTLVLAALDTGSNFGGMGASRELAVSVLVEPTLFLSLASLAVQAKSFDLGAMAGAVGAGGLSPGQALAAAAFAVVATAEMGRIPVDNPDTHLELTMIHEGMLLEYSGRHLALLTWGAYLKQLIVLSLLTKLFLGIEGWAALPVVLALGTGFGLVEFLFAKTRFFRLSRLLGASLALASLAAVTTLFYKG